MAENGNRDNRDTEHFVLGLIVAVILYFILRREFGKMARDAANGKSTSGAMGSCGCETGDHLPENPGVSVGNQSYNYEAFGAATVTPAKPQRGYFSESAPTR